jgi:hypothetical protein
LAYEVPGFCYTRRSYGNINQFAAVSVTSNGAEVATAAEGIDGITQMGAESTNPEAIRIMRSGISFATAGGTGVTEGELVEVVGSAGAFQDQDAGVAVGRALSTAADGEEFSILLFGGAQIPA